MSVMKARKSFVAFRAIQAARNCDLHRIMAVFFLLPNR